MSVVSTQDEANNYNENEVYGPYIAANGHLMVAPLRFPHDRDGHERNFEIGDEIRYDSWQAWCDMGCKHTSPPEDW